MKKRTKTDDIKISYTQTPETTDGAARINRAFDMLFEITLQREEKKNNKNENEKQKLQRGTQ